MADVTPKTGMGDQAFGNVGLSGLLTESAADALVATAGGGQANALQLASEVNRIITAATAGDSVKLPAATAGLTIMVINHGANAMQVFGQGTDQINDIAAATGVSQMVGSVVLYTCSIAGKWYTEGLATGYSGGLQTQSFANAITAFAGGGQASATQLGAMINRVTVVATAADSVKLPVAAGGLSITVINAHASNSMNVFPSTGDAINALSANAAFAVAAGKTATFFSTVAGQWHALLSA